MSFFVKSTGDPESQEGQSTGYCMDSESQSDGDCHNCKCGKIENSSAPPPTTSPASTKAPDIASK